VNDGSLKASDKVEALEVVRIDARLSEEEKYDLL
jgi:hypothetical protein